MKPTLGRIVHYMDPDTNQAMPGIVNSVDDGVGTFSITVFYKDGSTSARFALKQDNMASGPRDAKPNQWWWPERL